MKNGNNPKLFQNNLHCNRLTERLTANYISSVRSLVTCGRKSRHYNNTSQLTALSLWYFKGTLSQHLGCFSERNVKKIYSVAYLLKYLSERKILPTKVVEKK